MLLTGVLREHFEWDIKAEALEKINNYEFLKILHEKYGKVKKKKGQTTNWKNNLATCGRQRTNFCTEWSVPTNQLKEHKAKNTKENGQQQKYI